MKSRRMRAPIKPTYTRSHRDELLTGHDFFGLGYGDDEDGRHAGWLQHREQLLADWIAARGGPGTRPWGWWKYEAPELRRRLGGKGTPSLEDPDCPAWARAKGYSFGMPAVFQSDYDADDPPRYETELAYLKRLGLLTAEERAQLRKAS